MFGVVNAPLPFARGETYRTASAQVDTNLESTLLGKCFCVPNDIVTGLGLPVILRLVKNTAGSTLESLNSTTTEADRGNVMIWDVTSTHGVGRAVSAKCDTVVERCAGMIDPKYTTGIIDDDLFWIVVYGPCHVRTGDIASSYIVGDQVVADNDTDDGKVGEAASDAVYAAFGLGLSMEVAATSTNETLLIHSCVRGF